MSKDIYACALVPSSPRTEIGWHMQLGWLAHAMGLAGTDLKCYTYKE